MDGMSVWLPQLQPHGATCRRVRVLRPAGNYQRNQATLGMASVSGDRSSVIVRGQDGERSVPAVPSEISLIPVSLA